MKKIRLTQGKVALVDDGDFERVSKFKWYAHKDRRRFYALRSIKTERGWSKIRMHRFILSLHENEFCDHENGDGLDNQRRNLRGAGYLQNARGFRLKRVGTSSEFRGVHWETRTKKWRAFIGFSVNKKKKTKHLGRFSSEIEAAKAYDVAALNIFGNFACLNFK